MENEKLLLTVAEAAVRLGCGRSFLYKLLMRGEISSVTLGRSRRIPVAALEEFIQARLEVELETNGAAVATN